MLEKAFRLTKITPYVKPTHMRNLSPIVLFVYNRVEHAKQTIDALKANPLSKDSTLYIFSDGAKDASAAIKVDKIREYIHTVDGFKEVIIREQEKNIGLDGSIMGGVGEIVNRHGKVIVLEDDIVTAPFFLEYMNEALDIYQNEDRVANIHGFLPKIDKKMSDPFFLRESNCCFWGWATWKRGWDLYNHDGEKLLKEIYKNDLVKRFNSDNNYHNTDLLRAKIRGDFGNTAWDRYWAASIFIADKYSLYPPRSLVKNIGNNDGTGTHTTQSFDGLDKVEITDRPIVLKKQKIKESRAGYRAFIEFYKKYFPKEKKRLAQILIPTIKTAIKYLLPYWIVRLQKISKRKKILKNRIN